MGKSVAKLLGLVTSGRILEHHSVTVAMTTNGSCGRAVALECLGAIGGSEPGNTELM